MFLFHSRVRPASGDTKVKGDSRIGLGPVWLRGIRIGPSLYKVSGCGDTLPQEMTDISLIISLETDSAIRYHSQYVFLSFMFRFIVLFFIVHQCSYFYCFNKPFYVNLISDSLLQNKPVKGKRIEQEG